MKAYTDTSLPVHECQSWQEGDWLIFRCPKCSFLRKLNWQTGEIVTVSQGDAEALHKGSHSPIVPEIKKLRST